VGFLQVLATLLKPDFQESNVVIPSKQKDIVVFSDVFVVRSGEEFLL
jgi:hypothetical protein